jgi:hypothetical protein
MKELFNGKLHLPPSPNKNGLSMRMSRDWHIGFELMMHRHRSHDATFYDVNSLAKRKCRQDYDARF